MRTLLLTLVLSLAVAASLIVVTERALGRWGPQADVVQRMDERLNRIESFLTHDTQPKAPSASGTEGRGEPRTMSGQDITPDRLGEIKRLCGEIQGMILDLERDQRKDLDRVYTALLKRLDALASQRVGPAAAEDPAAKEALRAKLGEMGVRVIEEEGMIELVGRMGRPDRELEFIACAPGGKLHESLLVVDIIPSALKIGLEDLGLKEAKTEGGAWRKSEESVYIYVFYSEWKKPRRIETMIENITTGDTMELTPFVFTASYMETDRSTWERYYAADAYKHVIALTTNFAEVSVLACPLDAADRQNIWRPLAQFNPPADAEVKIFIRREANPEWDSLR